jgi:hypothetical protein
MAKIVPIDGDDIDRLQQRPGPVAEAEVREAMKSIHPCIEGLAQAYPGVVAIAAFAGGELGGILAIAASSEGNVYSAGVKAALKQAAEILAYLPHDLLPTFEGAYLRAKVRRAKEDARELEKAFSKP